MRPPRCYYVIKFTDPKGVCTRFMRAYWHKWFGKDRSGNPKGIVLATVGGLP